MFPSQSSLCLGRQGWEAKAWHNGRHFIILSSSFAACKNLSLPLFCPIYMLAQSFSRMAVEGTGKILEGVFGEANSSPKLLSVPP